MFRAIELPQIPLRELATRLDRIDLLHIDIQGGELDLVAQSLETISRSVAYMLIGTHSRTIEGELIPGGSHPNRPRHHLPNTSQAGQPFAFRLG